MYNKIMKFSTIFIIAGILAISFVHGDDVTTPASEITTLSLQSNPNVPSNNFTTDISQPSLSSTSSSDVTTMSNDHHHDSLKVLPLDMDKKNKEEEEKNSTMTQSSIHNDDDGDMKKTHSGDQIMAEFVNNDSDNQANRHQTHENHSSDVITEKEGRAINFPLEISSNNQNSTEPGHMQINLVKGSTDKPHIMSFFDLSDVSMDHDGDDDDDKANDEYSNMKKDKKQHTLSKEKIDGDKKYECSFNGTNYKKC